MNRVAFKMNIFDGQLDEYKKRHDAIWPELQQLLKDSGISNYSIFVDDDSRTLFASMTINDPNNLNPLASNPLMKKWWAYMSDIMETNEDFSPVTRPLVELFYLP
jgi:L-rhamnose mutarotase